MEGSSVSELEAMISLLDDDDHRVFRAVGDRLVELGATAIPSLRAVADEGDDAKRRARARSVLQRLLQRLSFDELIAYAQGETIDLEQGSLLLARTYTPLLEASDLQAQLDEIAEEISGEVSQLDDGEERLDAFLSGLHERLGFAGDADDFFNLENNYLDTVISRRRGIPITLIVLYILVGRRLKLRIRAIGAPRRALAHYAGNGYERYIDAFAGGKRLDYEATTLFLRRQGFYGPVFRDYLRPLDDREILERCGHNLIRFSDSMGRSHERDRYGEFVKALQQHPNRDARNRVGKE